MQETDLKSLPVQIAVLIQRVHLGVAFRLSSTVGRVPTFATPGALFKPAPATRSKYAGQGTSNPANAYVGGRGAQLPAQFPPMLDTTGHGKRAPQQLFSLLELPVVGPSVCACC